MAFCIHTQWHFEQTQHAINVKDTNMKQTKLTNAFHNTICMLLHQQYMNAAYAHIQQRSQAQQTTVKHNHNKPQTV